MCPGTFYTAFPVGLRPSSPTSGSPRKLLCTVTTPANQAKMKTSASAWGAGVCRSFRGPSNQQKGCCVSVWTCLRTIPIKNEPVITGLARRVKSAQTRGAILHPHLKCRFEKLDTFQIVHVSVLLREAGANPICLLVRGNVHPDECRASFYTIAPNRSYISLIDECKKNIRFAPALRYAKKNQCLNCTTTISNQNK